MFIFLVFFGEGFLCVVFLVFQFLRFWFQFFTFCLRFENVLVCVFYVLFTFWTLFKVFHVFPLRFLLKKSWAHVVLRRVAEPIGHLNPALVPACNVLEETWVVHQSICTQHPASSAKVLLHPFQMAWEASREQWNRSVRDRFLPPRHRIVRSTGGAGNIPVGNVLVCTKETRRATTHRHLCLTRKHHVEIPMTDPMLRRICATDKAVRPPQLSSVYSIVSQSVRTAAILQ